MGRLVIAAAALALLHGAPRAAWPVDERPGLGGWASRTLAEAIASPSITPAWGAASPVDIGDGVTWGAGRVLRPGW